MTSMIELRKAAKLTQGQAAEAIGVTQPTVCFWETLGRMPQLKYLPIIAHTYGVSIEDVVLALLEDADDD